jgi:hypothetical protein
MLQFTAVHGVKKKKSLLNFVSLKKQLKQRVKWAVPSFYSLITSPWVTKVGRRRQFFCYCFTSWQPNRKWKNQDFSTQCNGLLKKNENHSEENNIKITKRYENFQPWNLCEIKIAECPNKCNERTTVT